MFASQELNHFAQQHHLEGLCEQTVLSLKEGAYQLDRVEAFRRFYKKIENELLTHPIILKNDYCDWFQQGDATQAQVRQFLIQFSVFSNQFLIAQLHKMLNAETLEEMRASKEILANEIGVIFNGSKATHIADKDMEGDPEMGLRPATKRATAPEVINVSRMGKRKARLMAVFLRICRPFYGRAGIC